MIKGYKIISQPYEPVTEMTSVGCKNCRKTWLEEMVHTLPVRVNGALMFYDRCSECIDSGNSMLDGLNLFDKTPQEQLALAKQTMNPLPTPTPSEGKPLKKSGNSPLPKCDKSECKEGCLCLIREAKNLGSVVIVLLIALIFYATYLKG